MNNRIEENIDAPEFGWYAMNVEDYITGVAIRILISTSDPYLDDLGPRLRIDTSLTGNPVDMVAVFVDTPSVPPEILDPWQVSKLTEFINVNREVLVRYWNSTYENCYPSIDAYNDMVTV